MFVCSTMDMEPSVGTAVGFQRDPDTIKLFVGQIPKHYDEHEIRSIMEEFGPIHEINLIKDKEKGSKGKIKVKKGYV